MTEVIDFVVTWVDVNNEIYSNNCYEVPRLWYAAHQQKQLAQIDKGRYV